MQTLINLLRKKAAEVVLLLALYPLTLLGPKIGVWLEQNILSGITPQETGRLLGSILGLLAVALSYVIVLWVRASKMKNKHAGQPETIAALELELASTSAARDQAAQKYQKLKDEHKEELVTIGLIDFKRGKRTQGIWMMFCPKCHLPVGGCDEPDGGKTIECPAGNCDWSGVRFKKGQLEEVFKKLPK